MALENFGKLIKLKIIATTTGDEFEAMFNPESYSRTFSTTYNVRETVNSNVKSLDYQGSRPEIFKLKLLIDGTNVSSFGGALLSLVEDSVYDKVQKFLNLTCKFSSEKKDQTPNDLIIKWSKLQLPCRLSTVTVNYTLFTMEGEPLRAELDASFSVITKESSTAANAIPSNLNQDSAINTQPPAPEATVTNGIVIKVT